MHSYDLIDYDVNITVACSIVDDVANEYRAMWERQQQIVINAAIHTLACAGVALISLIYLVSVCGKNSRGEMRTIWIDKVWFEVHVAALVAAFVYGFALCVLFIEEYLYESFPPNIVYLTIGCTAALFSSVIISSLLSVIRNIKCGRFIESSLTFRVLRFCWRIFVRVLKEIYFGVKAFFGVMLRLLSKKTGAITIAALLIYTATIGFFGVFLPHSSVWLILGIIVFLVAVFVIARRARDLDEIKKGAAEVHRGNVAYKIPQLKCDDMQTLALDINDIARGLDESVAAKVRAERMKTELITNVSHDLKTPITSIISYTELLSKMDDLPDTARDYVAVIERKGERLKNLTQDLFDISKVQSGNERATLEKLDVAILINQSLGEHDGEIESACLRFVVDTQKDLYILADGRKMSRVIGNLIENILKYTMKNTRVFITARAVGGEVFVEFKNISSYPMDFDAEDIVGRFVRGDKSRTEDGNGLGLAIAKSYTELCGGGFEVILDGDMFKVILKFKKIS